MGTFIDGIGASENIDSSGERIIIAGMDISSLAVDGVFNWEHEAAKDAEGKTITVKMPAQIVGKVLKAKKIFSDKDCADEREAYFWEKCQTPFIYVMGELFDDYKDSARDVAGMFRYDSDKKGQNERNVMNFSIEGAKIDKQGMDVTKSMARKVTITVFPCNKSALAEMVPATDKKPKDDIDSLFKTETNIQIELFKTEDMGKFLETLKKSTPHLKLAPTAPTAAAPDKGTHMGKTGTGKDIHSHEKVHNYQNFSSRDHKDAANMHYGAIKAGSDPKMNQHHMQKMKLHMQASASSERKEQRFAVGKQMAATRANQIGAAHSKMMPGFDMGGTVKKAETAGSGMAAPSQLTGQAAMTKESVDKKIHKASEHEKGVHMPMRGTHDMKKQPGMSDAGKMAITANDKKAPIKPGGKERQAATARMMHSRKLTELKNMPKPNLTKTEELVTSQPKGNPVHLKEGDKVSVKGQKNNLTLKEHRTTASGKKLAVFHGKFGNEVHVHHDHLHDNFVTKLSKSDYWLERAEQEYDGWDKKDQFREFMSKRLPNLTKSQIDAFGATLVLKKSLNNESKLEELTKALKFDHPAGHKPSDTDATPKSNVPEHHKGKAPDIKGKHLTEVEHVEPHYSGSHDIVYLKSGHRSEHQPTGKYKAGDKVTIKPHIQGTHVLHHGHDKD